MSSNRATGNDWSETARRLVVVGYITAVAMPPIGLIVGIVLALRAPKESSRHWVWIVAISIVGAAGWTLIFLSGALTSTSNELN